MSHLIQLNKFSNQVLADLQQIADGNSDIVAEKRAKILLECAAGAPLTEIAPKYHMTPNGVAKLRDRFFQNGIKAVSDAPRSGRKPVSPSVSISDIKEVLVTNPGTNSESDQSKCWTIQKVADKLNTTRHEVKMVLKKHNLSISDQNTLYVHDFLDKDSKCEIRGVYLSGNTQIIALEVDPKPEITLKKTTDNNFSNDNVIVVTSNCGFIITEERNDCNDLSLWKSLNLNFEQNDFTCPQNDSIEYFLTNINLNNNFIIIVNNISDSNYELFNGLTDKIIVTNDQKNWLKFLYKSINTLSNKVLDTDTIYKKIEDTINIKKESDSPFVWFENKNNTNENDENNDNNENEINNKINSTISFNDISGNKITVRYDAQNLIPSLDNYFYINKIDKLFNINNILNFYSVLEKNLRILFDNLIKTMFNFLLMSFQELINDRKIRFRNVRLQTFIGKFDVLLPIKLTYDISSNEYIWSQNLLNTVVELIIKNPYESSVNFLNFIMNRNDKDSLSYRSVNDLITRLGTKVREQIDQCANEILEENNYNVETLLPNDFSSLTNTTVKYQGLREKAIEILKNLQKENPNIKLDFERIIALIETNPNLAINCQLDGVYAPHQKEERKVINNESTNSTKESTDNFYAEDSKFVSHSNAWFSSREGRQVFTASSMKDLAKIVVAYLLTLGNLDKREIVILSDMGRDIRDKVATVFAKIPGAKIIHILDWYHLVKKMNEFFSSALKGGKKNKQENHRIKKAVYRHLWLGDVSGALQEISCIADSHIKNKDAYDKMIKYLREREQYICCYALRKRLGLMTSSNRVESTNFRVVTKRQKHQGFSWGKRGSYALASLTALKVNNQLNCWLATRQISISRPNGFVKNYWSLDHVTGGKKDLQLCA